MSKPFRHTQTINGMIKLEKKIKISSCWTERYDVDSEFQGSQAGPESLVVRGLDQPISPGSMPLSTDESISTQRPNLSQPR